VPSVPEQLAGLAGSVSSGADDPCRLGVHRYVVERTIALLHWFRRLRLRWEIRDDIYDASLTLAPPSFADADSSADLSVTTS